MIGQSQPVVQDDVLREAAAEYASGASLMSADELTRGMSGASVHRLHMELPSGGAATAVVKVSAPGTGGLRLDGGDDVSREIRVYRIPLTPDAADHIERPALFGHGACGGMGWMLIEDVGSTLDVVWNVDRALQAVRAAAALDVVATSAKRGETWVTREHHAFEHHLAAAQESLDALERFPERMKELETAVDLGSMRDWLDDARSAADQLDVAPHAFQHGDLNNSNMGFSPDGSLMLIDWAQAGSAPVGSDVAVFLSGFLGFGGDRGSMSQSDFDDLVLHEYVRARGDGASVASVQRVVDSWSMSWALEARLGAGLPAAWRMERTSPVRAAILADVREGLERAARAAKRLSI